MKTASGCRYKIMSYANNKVIEEINEVVKNRGYEVH